MKTIKTMWDSIPNCEGIPFGRLGEELQKIPQDRLARVVLKEGVNLFSGFTLLLYPTREAAIAAVEKAQIKDADGGERCRIRLAIPKNPVSR